MVTGSALGVVLLAGALLFVPVEDGALELPEPEFVEGLPELLHPARALVIITEANVAESTRFSIRFIMYGLFLPVSFCRLCCRFRLPPVCPPFDESILYDSCSAFQLRIITTSPFLKFLHLLGGLL